MNCYQKSLSLLDRALKTVPLATQTFSKSWRYFPRGAAPVYLWWGEGGYVWDADKNKYLDLICGLATITLGYAYPRVDEAIKKQLSDGIIFSLPHPLEVELSELLTRIIPCAEMVRFTKTGSEATSAAIKAARAYTDREHIASFGYHGWHDTFSVITERPKGIPSIYSELIHEFEYNDIDSLRAIFDMYPVACVIMEPVIATPPDKDFLRQVRQLCHENGVVLIFDEIVTGFRWSLGGAQEYFGVVPDLATFGKGIANGMPLNCVVGKRDIMRMFDWESMVFFSSTFGGECLSLAAGMATINEIMDKKTIEHCWKLGERVINGLTSLGIKCLGYPCRPILELPDNSPEFKTLMIQELIKRGILIHSSLGINFCYSHTIGDIDIALNAFEDSLRVIKSGKVELEGQLIEPAFKRL